MEKLPLVEQKALGAWSGYEVGWGLPFDTVASHAGIDRKKVRRAVRALARKGLLQLHAVFNEDDGKIMGRCYCLTPEGGRWLDNLDAWIAANSLSPAATTTTGGQDGQ